MALQIAFALYPLCLVGIALLWMLTARPQSKSRWLVEVAVSGSIVAFAFLAGTWAFTSYYLRYVLIGLFALFVLYSYQRTEFSDTMGKGHAVLRLAFSVAILILFTILNALAVASHIGSGVSLNLSFPLATGTYYVLQGGNSIVTNPFHTLGGSRLALDIVKLNTFGNRAKGITSRSLEDYEAFGDKVYSPCGGIVLAVRDNLPDNAPGRPDAEHPEGNYVLINCGKAEILMAHLKQGSAAVAAGDVVALRQPLGKVGNSGNTLEPHLHICASEHGVEQDLIFDDRRLSLNSVVIATGVDAQPVSAADRLQAGSR